MDVKKEKDDKTFGSSRKGGKEKKERKSDKKNLQKISRAAGFEPTHHTVLDFKSSSLTTRTNSQY